MSLKDALIKCLSSSDEVSFGRTMSAIAFIACILWDTFFVGFAAWKFNVLTMNVHDILPASEQLRGQVTFCAACYAINKVTEIMSAFGSRNNNA
jgi:hypothetical protein